MSLSRGVGMGCRDVEMDLWLACVRNAFHGFQFGALDVACGRVVISVHSANMPVWRCVCYRLE